MDYDLADNESPSPLIFLYNHQGYLWKNTEVIDVVDKFLMEGQLEISNDDWNKTLHQFLLPLTKEYKVDFDKSLVQEIKDGDPEVKLFLLEKGDYLVFQPSFSYKGYETKARDRDEIIVPQGDKVMIVHRNREVEKSFISKLQNLHSNFIYQEDTHALALKGTDVLKNNWFFLFVDAMNEMKVPVFGFEALKNFRFNTAKPQTKIFISSNTDWFDAKVDIVFGDQKVTVAEVKRALANKQQFVQLNDGTLGILPEEWLKKYSLLFRVGEGKTNSLKLSRYHLSVVDELYENRDENELVVELEEKYERLREFDKINEIEPPEHLQNVLRPYQVAGYQWLNYLHEINWGGILADDMGLGKTVQALSFLEKYRSRHGKLKALVVCPTTLIYNWENEIKKFTPSLSYHIHHGGQRSRSKDELMNYEVTITTYGTLRSDIKLFVSIEFDYIILDESQAIKNPSSKVTRAASLLNAKHRLCMSGTPLQNNTFDIFAQMNFLNPGMLGTMEFFRQEFSIPIDKFGEEDRKEHLRKILYPFILRRTKEQVAKDLPEKQEMVLFCEMEDEQRKIYDAYRNDFRNQILGTIESQGIQRSQLTILQGLMKLRQICDSPAILNEAEKFENHSIKLDELTREITENIGNHKALIFSQFLGMLALIKGKLTELGVKFEYFDEIRVGIHTGQGRAGWRGRQRNGGQHRRQDRRPGRLRRAPRLQHRPRARRRLRPRVRRPRAPHAKGAPGEWRLGHFENVFPRHQRPVLAESRIERLRAIDPANLIDIAKTLGRHQRGLGALAFDNRIDDHGRTMNQRLSFLEAHRSLGQPIEHPARQLRRCRQRFCQR